MQNASQSWRQSRKFQKSAYKSYRSMRIFSWKSLESFSLSRIEHIMREQNFSLKFNDSFLRKFCEQSTALAHSTLSLSFNKTTAEAIPRAFPRSYAFAIGKLILPTFVSCTASTAKHKEHEILESRKAKLINFSGVSPHVVSDASRLELCASPITNSHVTINTLSASEPSLWLIMSTWSRQILDD